MSNSTVPLLAFQSPQVAQLKQSWKKNQRLIVATALCLWISGSVYSLAVFKPIFQSKASVLVKDSALKAKYITDDERQMTSSPSANPVLNTVELLKSNVI